MATQFQISAPDPRSYHTQHPAHPSLVLLMSPSSSLEPSRPSCIQTPHARAHGLRVRVVGADEGPRGQGPQVRVPGFLRSLPLLPGQKSVSGHLEEGLKECLLFLGTPPQSELGEAMVTAGLTLGYPNTRGSAPGRWLPRPIPHSLVPAAPTQDAGNPSNTFSQECSLRGKNTELCIWSPGKGGSRAELSRTHPPPACC